ncbi:MAG: hypothetical protein WCJ01_11050 [Ignavibacteria bacterium]
MLINLSNHPCSKWNRTQTDVAVTQFGGISDIQFPEIDPEAATEQVRESAGKYLLLIESLLSRAGGQINAVHLMGEFNFSYILINMLREKGILSVASTSKREVVEQSDGTEIIRFNFVRFRNYY